MTAAAEYVTEVPYTRNFHRQLAPSALRLVAAMGGVTPPPEGDFDYCELGSASGDTLVALAAANPAARFVGVDLSPEQVAAARDLAAAGQISNVRFIVADFEALGEVDLPDFDYVSAHGVLSWVSAPKWAAAVAFAQRKLKPGGLLYASYNALPGWAAIEPLRRLMLDHTETDGTSPAPPERGPHQDGTSPAPPERGPHQARTSSPLDRARRGLDYAKRLADGGAAFFANHPAAKGMLALAERAGLPYVVHEYFNAHHRPMYFADVARELGAAGLRYAGRLPLHLNVRALAVPPGLREVAAGIVDATAFETFIDYAQAEMLRSDVYVKSDAAPSPSARRDYFESTPFGTLAPAAHVKRSVRLPLYTLDFSGPLYDALIPAIAEEPAGARDLAARAKLAPFGVDRVADALQNLAVGGQAVPLRPAAARAAKRYVIPLAHNRAALARALGSEAPLVLASPAAGTGVSLSLLDAVCLHLLAGVEPAKRKAAVRALAAKRPLPAPGAGEDQVAAVLRELDTFSGRLAPKLVQLGILAGAE
jgi:SAM-dependent methyltransferase